MLVLTVGLYDISGTITSTNITETNVVWNILGTSSFYDGHFPMGNYTNLIWGGIVGSGASSDIYYNLTGSTDYVFMLFVGEYSGFQAMTSLELLDKTSAINGVSYTSTTGETAITNNPIELWIGSVWCIGGQTAPTDGFTGFGTDNGGNEYSQSECYLEKIVSSTGLAVSGTTISNIGYYPYYAGIIVTLGNSQNAKTFALMQNLPFNFEQTITGLPQSINQTFTNITSWQWLELNDTAYNSTHSYAFKFVATINVQSMMLEPVYVINPVVFNFSTNSAPSYFFGFDLLPESDTTFQVSTFITNYGSGFFSLPYSFTSQLSYSYQFSFIFLTNYTDGFSEIVLNVTSPFYNITVGYSNFERFYVPLTSSIDELSLNITGISTTTDELYYQNCQLWNVIPYTLNMNPAYTSFDGTLFTIPTGETNNFTIQYFINPNTNDTSNGLFYVYESGTYFMINPDDNTAESFLNQFYPTLTLVHTGTIINSTILITILPRIYQQQTTYVKIEIITNLIQNVGDSTYSHFATKTTIQIYFLKWYGFGASGQDLSLMFGITLTEFILILLFLGVPTYYAYTKIGKKAIYIGLLLGVGYGFVGLIGIPLWVAAIFAGILGFLLYQKIKRLGT